MRSRILILPPIGSVDAFTDVFARVAFHLAHAAPQELAFVVEPDLVDAARAIVAAPVVPEGFDPVAATAMARVAGSVVVHDDAVADKDALGLLADYVLVHDTVGFATSPWVVEQGRRTRNISLFEVDAATSRSEAAWFGVLGERLTRPSQAAEARRFTDRIAPLPKGGDAFVFGTGPSISAAHDIDVSHGVRIVCNTVILDDALMRHLHPHVVTFADPIFHFGPSAYAADFRAALRRRLAADPDLTAVIPLRYRGFLVDLMPEHDARIVGVPILDAAAAPVLDLTERFAVNPHPNVLTMMMLPLAATLGRRIGLVGFDGRRPDDDSFWQHGATVQLHDHLDTIKRVHPGFFAVDYEDYYAGHLATVERLFEECEARGIEVVSLAHSFMPPLARRSATPIPDASGTGPRVDVGASSLLVVSVDPDWVDDFGHHGPWFRRLSEELAARGVPAVSLASRAIVEDGAVLPTFTHPTTNPRAASRYARTFEDELTGAVERLLDEYPDVTLVLAFYTADTYHLAPLVRLARRHPGRVVGFANLMRAHARILQAASNPGAAADAWAQALARLIRAGAAAGITVTADTPEQAGLIADLVGEKVQLWPMASAARVTVGGESRSDDESLRIYCPAQSQVTKGVVEFTDAAARLIASGTARPARFSLRSVRQPAGWHPRIEAALADAAAGGVEVLDGGLTDEEYASAIESADIVVVPYRKDPFRTRTSSVVVEAAMAGKPIVVASGTWGADAVREAGAAVEFTSGDPADLARAISEAITRYDDLRDRAVAAAPTMAERYSMAGLAAFITDAPTTDGAAAPPDGADVADAELLLHAHEDGFRAGRQDAHVQLRAYQRQVTEATLRTDDLAQQKEQLHRDLERRVASDALRQETFARRTRELEQELEQSKTASEQRRRELEEAAAATREAQAARVTRLQGQVAARDRKIEELSKRPMNRLMSAFRRLFRRG